MPKEEHFARLQLTDDAKKELDAYCRLRGLKLMTVLSRLLPWFLQQDEITQASVLGHLSQEQLAVIAENRRKAAQRSGPPPHPRTARRRLPRL